MQEICTVINTTNNSVFRILKTQALAFISLSLLSSNSFAQDEQTLTIKVDQSADNTTGNCETPASGQCNLRAAVAKAVATSGTVHIRLTVDSSITAGEIAISTPPETLIPLKLKITGNDAQKMITGNNT